jgi:hypothetical protein
MHTPINTLARSAFAVAVLAGFLASAQVVEINDGETLTEADLLAGSFMGQSFELGPGLTFEINAGGAMGPINSSGRASPQRGNAALDFADALVRVNDGGVYLDGSGPTNVTDLRLELLEGGSLPGGLLLWGGSDIRIEGGSSGFPIRLYGDDRIEVGGGRHDFIGIFEGGRGVFSGGVRSGIRAIRGSTAEFIGNDFQINGEPQPFGDSGIELGETFAGVHPDGSVFIEYGGTPSPVGESSLPTFTLIEAALPPTRTEPFSVPAEPAHAGGLRPGQSLTLNEGGVLRDDFSALNASLEIAGGEVGRNLRTLGSDITVSGGVLGSASFFDGSNVSIADGVFAGAVEAIRAANLEIDSGEFRRGLALTDTDAQIRGGVSETLVALGDSRVAVSAGEFAVQILVRDDAALSISGGTSPGVFAVGGASVEFSGPADIANIGIGADASFRMLEGTHTGKLFGEGTFEILGGAVAGTVTLQPGAECTIVGGSVSDGLEAEAGSTLTVAGGTVGNGLDLEDGALLRLQGGSVGDGLGARGEARIVQTGGHLGSDAVLLADSSMIVSGGTVGDRFLLLGTGTSLELVVRSLTVAGESVAIAPGERITIDERDVALDAVLADGTPIDFFLNTDLFVQDTDYFNASAIVTALGAAPVPCGPADFAEPFATLDLADIVAFLNAFADQSSAADLDGNGSFDLNDVARFVDAFGNGCSA